MSRGDWCTTEQVSLTCNSNPFRRFKSVSESFCPFLWWDFNTVEEVLGRHQWLYLFPYDIDDCQFGFFLFQLQRMSYIKEESLKSVEVGWCGSMNIDQGFSLWLTTFYCKNVRKGSCLSTTPPGRGDLICEVVGTGRKTGSSLFKVPPLVGRSCRDLVWNP